jgi:hypothetical protein
MLVRENEKLCRRHHFCDFVLACQICSIFILCTNFIWRRQLEAVSPSSSLLSPTQEHITRELPLTLTSFIPEIHLWIIYCCGHPRSKVH